ncbi:DUF6086 family protein [Streptomyces sp. NPDC058001]|uniref:DUF6086 family protein n=1 Tax=Streptomyces sp. NPDC058001 TaxID=3346300 RepID=UPI0036EA1733
MSQYYDLGEETLWNPSNGASRLFRRQVAVHEAELGLPSGIGPMENDECQIGVAELAAFVDALLTRHRRTSHAVILALSEGFVVTVLVLAERAGIEVRWTSTDPHALEGLRDIQVPMRQALDDEAWATALRGKVGELSRFMPR